MRTPTLDEAIADAHEKIDALTEGGSGERVRLLEALAAILRVIELMYLRPKE